MLENCYFRLTATTFSGRIQFGRTEYRIESVKKSSPGSYHRHSHIDYGTDPQEYNSVLEDKMTDLHTIKKLPPVHKEDYTVAHVASGIFIVMSSGIFTVISSGIFTVISSGIFTVIVSGIFPVFFLYNFGDAC